MGHLRRAWCVVAVLALVLAGCGEKKTPEQIEAEQRQEEQEARRKAIEERQQAIKSAQERDFEKAMAGMKEDPQAIMEEYQREYLDVVAEHIFPFTTATKYLGDEDVATTPARAPVLYIVRLRSVDDSKTTGADWIDSIVRLQIAAAPRDRMLLNLVPSGIVLRTWRRAGDPPDRKPTPEDIIKDARALDADIVVYGRADESGGNMVIQLGLSDLRDNRTDTVQISLPRDQFAQALSQAIAAIARFSGVTDADVQATRMLEGVPSYEDFAAMRNAHDEEAARPVLRAALEKQPDSPTLLRSATQNMEFDEVLPVLNAALRRHPDDLRLLTGKALLLQRADHAAASLLLWSEIIRRYPASLHAHYESPTALREAALHLALMGQQPAVWDAWMDSVARCVAVHPRNYAVQWDYGYLFGSTAYFIESIAADENPGRHVAAAGGDRKKLYQRGAAEMTKALDMAPTVTGLMLDIAQYRRDAGENPNALRELVVRANLVDPKSIEVDLRVARFIGVHDKTPDYVKIIQDAVARAGSTPDVMVQVADAMVYPIYERCPDYSEAALKTLENAPDARYYGEVMEIALSDGRLVRPDLMEAFFRVIKGNGGWQVKWKFYVGYLSRVRQMAADAQKAGNWEDSLRYAENVLYSSAGDNRHYLYYCIVKSLWKLGRHEESMYRSDRALREFPNNHTFYYMWAIVAEEKGIRLEEAYEKARIAAPLDPENQGIKDLLKRLGEKLGKPTTVAAK